LGTPLTFLHFMHLTMVALLSNTIFSSPIDNQWIEGTVETSDKFFVVVLGLGS